MLSSLAIRRRLSLTLLVAAMSALAAAQELRLPVKEGSVKFAVIGDTGTGDRNQLSVAKALFGARTKFPYEFVLMVGDNIYGADSPADYENKFGIPYKPILDAGVKFYAALGNHDNPNQRLYKAFNMGGERYYTFKPGKLSSVRFFA